MSNLSGIRRYIGITQIEAAQNSDMPQSVISRLERQTDMKVSTLKKYVEAIDGELILEVERHGERIRITI